MGFAQLNAPDYLIQTDASGNVIALVSPNGNAAALGTAASAAAIHAATSKTPPVSADEFQLLDSASSFALKKLTWANLLAAAYTGIINGIAKTITAPGTDGAQTINKNFGSVNFAISATSLVVTNSLVTANSVVVATVATVDATMKSVVAVAGAGSFTLTANAGATAETRVNFAVFN